MATITGTNNFNDSLLGTNASDLIRPIYGGLTSDTVDGLGGTDRIVLEVDTVTSTDGLNVDFTAGTIVDTQYTISFSNIERLIITGSLFDDTMSGGSLTDIFRGLAGNDLFDGNGGGDQLFGDAGNDTLRGGGGNDYIEGGANNDALNGGSGTDTLVGGVGNDFYVVDLLNDVVIENANEGIDTISSTIGFSLEFIANVENLRLSALGGGVSGTGNSLGNKIFGNGLNNILSGLGAVDRLFGGDGNDKLFGGDERDFLFGEDGNDELIGGAGVDNLTGGAGEDQFIFNSAFEGRDNILDFSVVDDLIVVDRAGFGLGGGRGILSADNFVIGTVPVDGDDFFIYDNTTGILRFDSNGNVGGGSSQIARLSGLPVLTADNIFLS